jgi:hypothetical protein
VRSEVWRCEGGRRDGSLYLGPLHKAVSGVCSTTSRETTGATLTAVGLSKLPVE